MPNNSKSTETPILLRYRDAAAKLSVSERYVHDLANEGILDRVKVGNHAARITTASVLALANKRTEGK